MQQKKETEFKIKFHLQISPNLLFSVHWNGSQNYVFHISLAPLYVFINCSYPSPWASKLLKEAITYCKYNYLVVSTLFEEYF